MVCEERVEVCAVMVFAARNAEAGRGTGILSSCRGLWGVVWCCGDGVRIEVEVVTLKLSVRRR